MSDEPSLERQKELMLLMTQHQRRIFAYIHALVPSRADAEDLLQETSLVVVEKFHEFASGTDFVAWACQIAWWRVRASRQKFARSKVVFDDASAQIHPVSGPTARAPPLVVALAIIAWLELPKASLLAA